MTKAPLSHFEAVSIVGDTRVDIRIVGMPGTVASQVHGSIGRELVRLANERIDQINEEESSLDDWTRGRHEPDPDNCRFCREQVDVVKLTGITVREIEHSEPEEMGL